MSFFNATEILLGYDKFIYLFKGIVTKIKRNLFLYFKGNAKQIIKFSFFYILQKSRASSTGRRESKAGRDVVLTPEERQYLIHIQRGDVASTKR